MNIGLKRLYRLIIRKKTIQLKFKIKKLRYIRILAHKMTNERSA